MGIDPRAPLRCQMTVPGAPAQREGVDKEYLIDWNGATYWDILKKSPLYGDQKFKDTLFETGRHCADLLASLRMSVSSEYLTPALMAQVPDHDFRVLAFQIAEQLAIQFVIVAAAGALGGLIGGAAGTIEVPLAGTYVGAEGGAVLGAAIAEWCLTGMTLGGFASWAGTLWGLYGPEFQAGVELAKQGDRAGAARKFADFFANIIAFLINFVIVEALSRGGKAVLGPLMTRTTLAQRMKSWASSSSLDHRATLREASHALGMTREEIQAQAQASRGKVWVTRGCTPGREALVERQLARGDSYRAKPVYAKWKTLKSDDVRPQYRGRVALNDADLRQVLHYYQLRDNGQLVLRTADVNGAQVKVPLTLDQKLQYVREHSNRNLVLDGNQDQSLGKPIYGDHEAYKYALNGHQIRMTTDWSTRTCEPRYLLYHPDGSPIIADIDRVVSYEYGQLDRLKAVVLGRNRAWTNDDARELAHMNSQIRRLLRGPQSYSPFQHGYAWHNLERNATTGKMEPGWPGRNASGGWDFNPGELLLVCINGHAYIMNWQQFGQFCKAFSNCNWRFPWQ